MRPNVEPMEIDPIDSLESQMNDRVVEEEDLDLKLIQNKEDFKKFYMRMYLKMHAKYLIAKYKTNEILDDIDQIFKISNSYMLDFISKAKATYSNPGDVIDVTESYLRNNQSLYQTVHAEMKYESVKEKWIVNSGFFVPPTAKKLDQENSYQYVPIIESIQAMFRHEEINKLYFSNMNQINETSIIQTIRDSENFKNNQLYKNEPNSLQIILYNDTFDTNNPLGDTRKKDKMNGTYFKLGSFFLNFSYKFYILVVNKKYLYFNKRQSQFVVSKRRLCYAVCQYVRRNDC